MRLDQPACFAAAEISRGRADQLGDCQRRNDYRLTTMRIDAGMDTGDMFLQDEMAILPAKPRRN